VEIHGHDRIGLELHVAAEGPGADGLAGEERPILAGVAEVGNDHHEAARSGLPDRILQEEEL